MLLHRLQRSLAVEHRILPREAGDEADRVAVLVQLVEEAAPELMRAQRVPEGVEDEPLARRLRDLDQLLDAERVDLWIASLAQMVPVDQVFAQCAVGPFAEDRQLRLDVDARLVVGLASAAPLEPLVPRRDSGHTV